MLQLYTCEDNVVANEYDFKKALDLLEYVKEDKESLKLRIWARTAKRDQWDIIGKNPEQQVQETVFFKLMDLAHFMGWSSVNREKKYYRLHAKYDFHNKRNVLLLS